EVEGQDTYRFARSNASVKLKILQSGRRAAARIRRYLSWRTGDANLVGAMAQARLRSSFIYLANAVNDLRGNWAIVAVVLAPLALASALCLLPDALNL